MANNTASDMFRMAKTLESQGKLDEALSYYRQVIAIRPEHAGAYLSIGNILSKQGQSDLAVEHYYKALRYTKNKLGLWIKLGDFFSQNQQLDKSISCYGEALTISPENINLYKKIGDISVKASNFSRAKESYEKVLTIHPDLPGVHLKLAQICQQTENLETAKLHLEKVIELRPNSVKAYCYLGKILAQTNQIDEAIQIYQCVINIDPCHQSAQKQLQRLLHVKETDNVEEAISIEGLISSSDLGSTFHQEKVQRKSGYVPFSRHKRRGPKSVKIDETGFKQKFAFSPEAVGNYDQAFQRTSVRVAIVSLFFIFYGFVSIFIFIKGLHLLGIMMITIALSILLTFWIFGKVLKE